MELLTDLQNLLANNEWYDNSTIALIQSCRRKGYWGRLHKGRGLGTTIGNGGNFGSCMHAAQEIYYNGWGRRTLAERKDDAYREFLRQYSRYFPPEVVVDNKHTLERGLAILGEYFDSFESQDHMYRPIHQELGIITSIYPLPGEPSFAPFLWVSRLDGLWQEVSTERLWVRELKNVGQGVETEIDALKLSRQPRGYTWAARQFQPVVGVLADVVLIAAVKIQHQREAIFLSTSATDEWRLQTIEEVESWRRLKARGEDAPYPWYTQTAPGQCISKYGKCYFYDICLHGPIMAEDLPLNDWSPFKKMEDTI